MKILLMGLLLLMACGKEKTTTNNNPYPTNYPVDPYNQNINGNWMAVTFSIPNQNSIGAARSIKLNNKSYLIGTRTSQEILNLIYTFPPGNIQKNIQGEISVESGLFPNPTVQFDVIHIFQLQ